MALRASKKQHESGDAKGSDYKMLALQKAYLQACEYPKSVGSQVDDKNSAKFVAADKTDGVKKQDKPFVKPEARGKDPAEKAEKEPVAQTMARKFANSKSTGPNKNHAKKSPVDAPMTGHSSEASKQGNKYEALHKAAHTSSFSKKVADYHSK